MTMPQHATSGSQGCLFTCAEEAAPRSLCCIKVLAQGPQGFPLVHQPKIPSWRGFAVGDFSPDLALPCHEVTCVNNKNQIAQLDCKEASQSWLRGHKASHLYASQTSLINRVRRFEILTTALMWPAMR